MTRDSIDSPPDRSCNASALRTPDFNACGFTTSTSSPNLSETQFSRPPRSENSEYSLRLCNRTRSVLALQTTSFTPKVKWISQAWPTSRSLSGQKLSANYFRIGDDSDARPCTDSLKPVTDDNVLVVHDFVLQADAFTQMLPEWPFWPGGSTSRTQLHRHLAMRKESLANGQSSIFSNSDLLPCPAVGRAITVLRRTRSAYQPRPPLPAPGDPPTERSERRR